MENYIVRIYRRDANDPNHVIGTVEHAETRERSSFHSLAALIGLLSEPDTKTSGDGKPRPDRTRADDGQDIQTKTG